MAVLIGSARIAETGGINGTKGDQTGKEVAVEKFYVHRLGWIVLRPYSSADAEKMAKCMEGICANNNFGYGQATRLTGFNELQKVGFDPKKVKTKCNIDCSEAIRACCWAAGIKIPDIYTGNLVSVLTGTGKFKRITFTKEADLKRGDVLCTKRQGHTALVLSNGSNFGSAAKPTTTPASGGTSGGLNKLPKWEGIVTADALNVRTWAGANNSKCSFSPLYKNAKVGVCDSMKGPDKSGKIVDWYYIKHNGRYGFVCAKYIKKV